jgi:hypothetical protein
LIFKTFQPHRCDLISVIVTSMPCVFLQPSLDVQANMIEPRNGQSQSEPEQSKPMGRFFGRNLFVFAQTPTGLAELVRNGFPIFHATILSF